MVKPDGVQRGLVGDIIKRFEQKGFKLVAMKFMQVGKSDSMARHFLASYADILLARHAISPPQLGEER